MYKLILVILFCLHVLPALSQDVIISSIPVGECTLRVEANETWHTMRLRAHHPQHKGCMITRDAMLEALDSAFAKSAEPRLSENYSSLFIGRLIDYPWLCHFLADSARRDSAWDLTKGQPLIGHVNHYVADILSAKKLMTQLETPFLNNGYRMTGVSVEKVLVGGFDDVPFYQGEKHRGLVPFDAMVWFRLIRE